MNKNLDRYMPGSGAHGGGSLLSLTGSCAAIRRLRGFAGTHVRQLRRTGYAQRDVVVGKDRLFGKVCW